MLTELLALLSKGYGDGAEGERARAFEDVLRDGRAPAPGGARQGTPGARAAAGRAEHFDLPVFGDPIEASDYTRAENWLNLPGVVEAPRSPSDDAERVADLDVDVFFAYPTAWRAQGGYPLATIDNRDLRANALRSLWVRASAFGTVGRIFAPYYRQMDAAYIVPLPPSRTAELIFGAPLTDVAAAFRYYLEHHNEGRPFMLVGHSQGSMVLSGLLMTALAPTPPSVPVPSATAATAATASVPASAATPQPSNTPLERMVAAYLVGSTWSRAVFDAAPFLKPATCASDTGVIISYNTEAPVVDGPSPFSRPGAVTINPVSWRTDDALAPASLSKGGIVMKKGGGFEKREQLADARIDPQRGTIVCSSVDRERFSSPQESRAYFPLGVFHENDIALYYFDLRANAELRARTFLSQ